MCCLSLREMNREAAKNTTLAPAAIAGEKTFF
jgi:hypothetical protein